jgi:predicted Rossmann fold flavoprotein
MTNSQVIIIGAGAAGLMCAISAAQRGRKVMVLDHSERVAGKILISGGGRCNFTNYYIDADNYISSNPNFCKSALSRYTQYDFIDLLEKNGISYEERTLGQLFCVGKAKEIVNLLLTQCQQLGVDIISNCKINKVYKDNNNEGQFYLQSSLGNMSAESLVVATGGLSIPKMGASDFGHRIAKQFNLNLIKLQPALVPLCLESSLLKDTKTLAGISVESLVSCNNASFRENILFTHKGLSGPAILQISSYWEPGKTVEVNLLPDVNCDQQITAWQQTRPKSELKTLLSERLTKRLVQCWQDKLKIKGYYLNKPISHYKSEEINNIMQAFQQWQFIPTGTEGFRVAEVTKGGVDCNEFSSKTFEANKVSNLYFIGEVLDVTGWLGGYNFQWAWSSGFCAGQYV